VEFFTQLNVATWCKSMIYTIHRVYANIIWSYWLRVQDRILNTIPARDEPVCVSSERQYDSTGLLHTAFAGNFLLFIAV
jgi:hypothetical protein